MKLRRRPRPTLSRWALWLFAAALLLKSAMPMLATASAERQGKAVVEVCTVYGMSMVSVEGARPAGAAATGHGAPAPDDAGTHVDHQCALTALAALLADDPPPLAAALTGSAPARLATAETTAPPGRDAAADWVARRKQGPPTRL